MWAEVRAMLPARADTEEFNSPDASARLRQVLETTARWNTNEMRGTMANFASRCLAKAYFHNWNPNLIRTAIKFSIAAHLAFKLGKEITWEQLNDLKKQLIEECGGLNAKVNVTMDEVIADCLYQKLYDPKVAKYNLSWSAPLLKKYFGESYKLGRVWIPDIVCNLDEESGKIIGKAYLAVENGTSYYKRAMTANPAAEIGCHLACRLNPILKTMIPGLTLRTAILNDCEAEIENALEILKEYGEPMTSWHELYKSPSW